jgi:triphosphoribosyl-dephospho-CoA synthase
MQHHKSRQISQSLELAILLEASAHKPGNISLVTNFENTRFEHFLASAVAATPSFELAAERGTAVAEGKSTLTEIGLGQLIKDCVAEVDAWQHGGNTLLGTIILLSPIAVAAGMTSVGTAFEARRLRKALKLIVESTTPEDAVNLYKAIKIANPGGLGEAPDLDINDPESESRILRENVSLFQVFKIAEKYDTICSEWVNNYPLTFDMAYPILAQKLRNGTDLNEAIIHTFLEVLANVPDTFIARKVGLERSRKVSANARKVLDLGGLKTADGTKSLHRFDNQLRRSNNLLNPGTTADIIGAALSLCVLSGYRP